MRKTEEQQPTAGRPRRRPYRSPRLSVYGLLKDLTTGGTGAVQEPNPKASPPNKHP